MSDEEMIQLARDTLAKALKESQKSAYAYLAGHASAVAAAAYALAVLTVNEAQPPVLANDDPKIEVIKHSLF